jgi:hypothetical protein
VFVKELQQMKKVLVLFFVSVIVFSGIFTGCGNVTPTTNSSTPTTSVTSTPDDGFTIAWCKETLNSFRALQPTAVPENLAATGVKIGGEFDANSYFTALKHISPDEGFVLDYTYITDQTNGGPILYVRPADLTPFYTYNDYKTATHNTPRQDKDKSTIWLVKGTDDTGKGNNIKIDGTRQGYFEYVVLQTISNEFYLLGGAVVNDKQIVCDKASLDAIWAEIEAAGLGPVDAAYKDKAQQLDFTPIVTIHPDVAQVTVVIFSKLTGFTRYSYYINKDYPHFINNIKDEVLMDNKFKGQ